MYKITTLCLVYRDLSLTFRRLTHATSGITFSAPRKTSRSVFCIVLQISSRGRKVPVCQREVLAVRQNSDGRIRQIRQIQRSSVHERVNALSHRLSLLYHIDYRFRSSTRAWSRRTSSPSRDRSSTWPAMIFDARPTAWWHSTSPLTPSVRTARYRHRRPQCLTHRHITIPSCIGTATRISKSATMVSATCPCFISRHNSPNVAREELVSLILASRNEIITSCRATD